ncbi:MAG: ATP-dependent DNA helicase RecG [Chloroflexi bacterium]|nr:ATP-dependent DNA helicase RecG [Chloroflexota bacterium]MBT7080436.1 ATP-dependent DNA helicase RecG [Chloroflexota bacterium]MBT7290214.1 ATP-dependent DNA helicase RecG [Chloroflexota bacterium]
MSSALEQFQKVLNLEKDRGCDNTAVFGGLDKYLDRLPDKSDIKLPSPSYADLSVAERKKWIDAVIGGGAKTKPVRKATTPKPKTKAKPKQPVPESGSLLINSPITDIKGISARMHTKFNKLNVHTIKDMLYFFPRRHIDYSKTMPIAQLEVGVEQTVIGTIWQAALKGIGRFGRKATEVIIGDQTGNMRIVWFNQPYLVKKMRTNEKIAISGRISSYMGQKVFESPVYEILTSDDLVHTGRLVPVYPLTEGLAARTVRRHIKAAVDLWASRLPDFLPRSVKDHAGLMSLGIAIEQAHYPDSEQTKNESRTRLAFDELFLIQLGVLSRRREWQEQQDVVPLDKHLDCVDKFVSTLPYALTGAQRRALDVVLADMGSNKPMSRLIQGDVGSGKTVVAAAAIILAVANSAQVAFMAPTEILAEQHYRTIAKLFGASDVDGNTFELSSDTFGFHIRVCLLMGSTKKKDRKPIYESIADGSIDIVIGTHAIIQESVEFKELGFAIVDEQHRFGVLQRSALREKGTSPHVLVMSATPIPRTLALTLYGDLDISVIDEMPPGRQEIMTRLGGPQNRSKAYQFIHDKIKAEQQAFIICPLVEESEAIDAKAAVAEHARLTRDVFPQLNLGLIHGRMSSADKEEAMHKFKDGEYNILVSTSVVEVGIDVPNATVMLIEGADRFGLSQLHQFRGRVGRGDKKSYCILLAEKPSSEATERLQIMEQTSDGFKLAEEDLRLRGAGEFFGTRQSGLPDLRMARLSDTLLLEQARAEAIQLFKDDPNLAKPEHALLLKEVDKLWSSAGESS